MGAAMMAGWVQNLKIPGVGHAIAHQLASCGIHHGSATGLMLVPAMRFNCADANVRRKYDQLARSIGLADAQALIDSIAQLRRALDLPNPLAAIDVNWHSEVVSAALADACARA